MPRRHLNRRVDGADAEHERVVAAVAAAERAHRVRREQSRARRTFASSSLEAAAGLKPVDAKQQPLRSPSPRHRAPRRHLKPRTNGADAERERVVDAIAKPSAHNKRTERRAERATIAHRPRVRRRPASSQPTPSSRRRDPSPLATARLAVTSKRRGDGADAERERVVAAVATAESAL